MNNNQNFFIGIDLGGRKKPTTGVCILEEKNKKIPLYPSGSTDSTSSLQASLTTGFKKGERIQIFKDYPGFCRDLKYSEILKTLKPYLAKTKTIAIDAPLTLGRGKGLMRLYEKFLSTKIFRQEKVMPLPPAIMPEISLLAQELVKKLEKFNFILNINLIETFPTLVKKICTDDFSARILNREKFPCKSPHQESALICALVSYLHFESKTRYLGYKDGFLFVPEMSLWEKEWQKKFYEAWRQKPYLKYRRLTTNIFKP